MSDTDTTPDLGSVYQMQLSPSLKGRVIAAADALGAPLGWGAKQFGAIINDTTFTAPWAAHVSDDPRIYIADTGLRPDVVTDEVIITRVTAVLGAWQAAQGAADGSDS